MIILKHVKYKINNTGELDTLLEHLKETTSMIHGVKFKDIYFPINKDEFVLMLDCMNENKYLEWRKICPPPNNSQDWYEVLLSKDERFK
jgi:hypothetical protein